jgi:hypothetical protein
MRAVVLGVLAAAAVWAQPPSSNARKLQGVAVPAPGAADNGKSLTYDHATRSYKFAVGGASTQTIVLRVGADGGSPLTDAYDEAGVWQNRTGSPVTIVEVWCQSDGGTPRIQVQRNRAGVQAAVLTDNANAGMDCAADAGQTGTLHGTNKVLANLDRIDLQTVTAGGVAKRYTVQIRVQ